MGSLSMEHECLRILMRDSPAMVLQLVGEILGASIPAHERCEIGDGDFTQIKPVEFDADQVLLLYQGEQPVMALILEVQRNKDAGKRTSWPLYAAALHARLSRPPMLCPVAVLVIATTDAVARWAAKPITSFQPGSQFAPWVVGPAQIPRITRLETARENIALAVLSALLHGNSTQGEQIATAALQACVDLDSPRSSHYTDLMLATLGELAKDILEAMMQHPDRNPYLSDYYRNKFDEGWAAGEARGVLKVLQTRGFEVSEGLQTRVLSLRAIPVLDNLIVLAVTTPNLAAFEAGLDAIESAVDVADD
jgi:hypothetical protein